MSIPVMRHLLVAGSGTDIGKTHVSCLLLRHLAARGISVLALKPVLSGYAPGPDSDIHRLLAAAGLPTDEAYIHACCPWRFSAPLAPPMAAAKENRSLRLEDILDFCRKKEAEHDGPLLLETAGGIMSPLGSNATCLDLARALEWPIAFIGGSYLGAISHTLCGLEVIKAAGLHVALTVISESEGSAVPLEETREAVQRHSPFSTPVLALPRHPLDLTLQNSEDMMHILAAAGFS